MSEPTSSAPPAAFAAWARRHPWLVSINLISVIAGPLVIGRFLPDWELWRILVAGLLAGAGFGYLVTARRLVGDARD